ncbi:hypothetical protein AA0229_1161 [Gluconobacter cerinus NRIC 0229]|nr:hypothetical protein AA0229_1161 [Gluconobacter cerinus NRIC 0229]
MHDVIQVMQVRYIYDDMAPAYDITGNWCDRLNGVVFDTDEHCPTSACLPDVAPLKHPRKHNPWMMTNNLPGMNMP